jgi:hypothetical protein
MRCETAAKLLPGFENNDPHTFLAQLRSKSGRHHRATEAATYNRDTWAISALSHYFSLFTRPHAAEIRPRRLPIPMGH